MMVQRMHLRNRKVLPSCTTAWWLYRYSVAEVVEGILQQQKPKNNTSPEAQRAMQERQVQKVTEPFKARSLEAGTVDMVSVLVVAGCCGPEWAYTDCQHPKRTENGRECPKPGEMGRERAKVGQIGATSCPRPEKGASAKRPEKREKTHLLRVWCRRDSPDRGAIVYRTLAPSTGPLDSR